MARVVCILISTFAVSAVVAQEPTHESLQRGFLSDVQPLLRTHCLACHDTETQEAKLDLSRFHQLADITNSYRVWEIVLERVDAGEMPPDDANTQLTDEQRETVVQWIRNVRQFEANRNSGDPGPVLARRLSNAEYDYSIRDLTGADIRPTKTFPVDPANEAGFDNSGESLSMSPALMTKYLAAARTVVDHLVLTPQGIHFAPHPVVTDVDRDKYCVKRIVEFYRRQPTDYATYFYAAWSFKHRSAHGKTEATLNDIAKEHGVSRKYLATIWQALSDETKVDVGPLAKVQRMWKELPNGAPPLGDQTTNDEVRDECERLRDFVLNTRKRFEPKFDSLRVRGVHVGSQPFVLWRNDQYASQRRSASFQFPNWKPSEERGRDKSRRGRDRSHNDQPEDIASIVEFARELFHEPDRQRFLAAYEQFCSVFPDAFYISERGRGYLDEAEQRRQGATVERRFS